MHGEKYFLRQLEDFLSSLYIMIELENEKSGSVNKNKAKK